MLTINLIWTYFMSNKARVCAIVVTRNRVNYLRRLLSALRKQSYPISHIILVDNDSSDGTRQYLRTLERPKSVTVIEQENCGGAGGFHRGLSECLNANWEWAWLMDDDGFPTENALENLHPENETEPYFRNSLVCDEVDLDRLAFGLFHLGKTITESRDPLLQNGPVISCNPFNGTLLHRNLVRKIGTPIPEFFIKGDETEYQRRAELNGFVCNTFIDSIFLHPRHREPNVISASKDREWVFFFKVRNFQAMGTPSGKFSFKYKSSLSIAKIFTRDLALAYFRGTIPLTNFSRRLKFIWSGVIAARINSAQFFLPKKWYRKSS